MLGITGFPARLLPRFSDILVTCNCMITISFLLLTNRKLHTTFISMRRDGASKEQYKLCVYTTIVYIGSCAYGINLIASHPVVH